MQNLVFEIYFQFFTKLFSHLNLSYTLVMMNYCFSGTRIIYDRTFLLQMRNSPMARTPPTNLPNIPGVTCDAKPKLPSAQKTSPGHKQGENSVTEVDKGLF